MAIKAALIGAVAIGGATAAALTWAYIAAVDPRPPADPLADPSAVPAADPPPAATAATDRPVTEPTVIVTRDAREPPPGSPAAPPDRQAALAPEAAANATPTPGRAAGDRAVPDVARVELAPSFDLVRVDADGQTVIAGRGAPNEQVEVLLDGRVVETMLADAGGRFVAVLSTGASSSPRELRLRVALPGDAASADPTALPVPTDSATGLSAGLRASGPPTAPETVAQSGTAEASAGPAPLPADGRAEGLAGVPPRMPSPSGRTADPQGASAVSEAAPATPPSDPPSSSSPYMRPPAPGREAGGLAAADADARAPAPPEPGGRRYLLSDAVIILPTERDGDTPAIVEVQDEELALLQPGGARPGGVVLDQLTREPGGDLLLRGRARPGHAVRIYGNDKVIDTVPAADGGWSLTVPEPRAGDIRLFRLDEIARSGTVASRIEVPFQPSEAPSQVVRDRRITVQRGDNLWRIAEAHYGEGIRYSLIFGANSDLIRNPDLIYPDQVFTVPELVEAE